MEAITPKYHTARDAAEIIGVSYRLILKWINDGELKCYRIGDNGMIRISNEQITEFLGNHEINSPCDNGDSYGEDEIFDEPA